MSEHDEDIPELIALEPGQYDAVYQKHECLSIFRVPKVRVDFQLLAHPGLTLPRWYRVKGIKGRISAGKSSDIVREVSDALGRRVRSDRVPISDLAGRVVRVCVRTVDGNSRQDNLSSINRYSVIDKLLHQVQ